MQGKRKYLTTPCTSDVLNNPCFYIQFDIVSDPVQPEVPLRMTEKCIEKLRPLKKFWSSLGIFLFPSVALNIVQSSEKDHHWVRVRKIYFTSTFQWKKTIIFLKNFSDYILEDLDLRKMLSIFHQNMFLLKIKYLNQKLRKTGDITNKNIILKRICNQANCMKGLLSKKKNLASVTLPSVTTELQIKTHFQRKCRLSSLHIFGAMSLTDRVNLVITDSFSKILFF